ncbi:hypothetical protein SAMN06265784_104128 [Paraburkholderia susongensis]|uniref:Uncharacterized protein n=1 Tax=Paraburkholderia susongensis TaxID=1515439 RepID=A0A1X7KP31_9BURK|nr:hypothetical protein SAMN06265784_104128 [Paraburkholderia susongensis]
MRPAASHLFAQARAYAHAHKPTSALIHALADAVARELAHVMGGPVTISLPGRVVITRSPGDKPQ